MSERPPSPLRYAGVLTRAPQLYGLSTSALFEMMAGILVILVVDLVFFDGTRFRGETFHPFWLVVVLIAAQYGTAEGLAAAIISSIALLVGNLPPQPLSEDLYAWLARVALLPALWLSSALVIGELTQRKRNRIAELELRMEQESARRHAAEDSARRFATANQALEERIAGQIRTVINLYRGARAVEGLTTGDVLLGIAELVRAVMSPAKFSIFFLNNGVLEASFNEGWSGADTYTRLIAPGHPLHQAICGQRRHLSFASREDARVLGREGILAGPIASAETGALIGMLKIEQLGFLDLNFSAIQNFRILCDWIGHAFSRAEAFARNSERSSVGAGGAVMSSFVLKRFLPFMQALAKRQNMGLGLAEIEVAGVLPGSQQEVDKAQAVADALSRAFRDTDIAFATERRDRPFAVVLPAVHRLEADQVAERLKSEINARLRGLGYRGGCEIFVRMLHEPEDAARMPAEDVAP